ncbi:MAG: hypothetical protein ACRDT4_05175 [Micromonosporaceae bacterium]
MSAIELRLIGPKDQCLTIVALLSQLAPVEVKAVRPDGRHVGDSPRRRIYAEIHTRLRDT